MRFLVVAVGACVAAIVTPIAACDSSVRVGELREDAAAPEGGPLVPPPDADTTPLTWKLHSPLVPCSIYAMAEIRSDDTWLGCNGGGIYRYDGVKAKLAYSAGEESIVSLLWIAPDGQVWAGAQSGFGTKATTKLLHFDGTAWKEIAVPKERITSITGVSAHDLWLTTDTKILRLRDGVLTTSLTSPGGAFRDCTFAADGTKGYCVGTAGLAMAWDGTAWSPLAGAPWTAAAEVFGVDLDSFDKSVAFFYGEPIKDDHGDHECHATRFAGTFNTLTASTPCFVSFDVARKRAGHAIVSARNYLLFSEDENYGGALVFDPVQDKVDPLCGPVLAFSRGLANTRVGGRHGLLATITGSGGNQIALTSAKGSNTYFEDLAVAPDGTAWARTQDTTVCGSISDTLVRFEDNAAWQPVAGPQGAQSGRGLAAAASDRAFTFDQGRDVLMKHVSGTWVDGPTIEEGWSLFAARPDDVWIGGYNGTFGHFDGKTYRELSTGKQSRQILQVVPAGKELWMVALGYVAADTHRHVVRYADGKTTEWDLGLYDIRLSAVDATHVWMSGEPAQAWDGKEWKLLPFDASYVWARAIDEVYFTDRGDISRWNGKKLERVHHGFNPIMAIGGAGERGFAVGPGGLTIELGRWPNATH
jgi:hypothetical protein